MALAYVLLSSFTAFGSAGVFWLTGGGFWGGIGVFYLAAFGTLAALIAWQCVARPAARTSAAPLKQVIAQG